MFDVNQITTTLRGLPDRMLQQYAMMNKGNPYVLSLAVAESNQRKQLRTAAQARNAMPQPKVADAAIAGMSEAPAVDAMGNVTGMAAGGLPEDYGIGRLPAPNMQRMADGGIAGYGDGDDVPKRNGMAMGGMYDFAQRSEPVLRMSGGGEVKRYAGKGEQLVRTTDGGKTWFLDVPSASRGKPSAASALANQKFSSRQEAIAAYDALESTGVVPDTAGMGMGMPTGVGMPAGTDVSKLTQPAYVPPAVVPGAVPSAAPAPAPGAKPAPQAALPTGGASVKEAQNLGEKFFDLKGIKGTLEQQQAQERQDITNEKEARAEKMAAFNKEQGPAMAGYEKLLKSEEMQDATDKEKAGLMSLMKGFLAMAGGESPNAATNIAKGAMVGLGDYGDALKEFKKSAKERNKAMAEIENARRAEAKGDLKDSQMYEDKANDYLRASQRHGIDSIISATGKSAEVSAGLYKTMVDNASANARTMAQINAPSGIERVVDRMARDPKFAEAYKNYASIGPEAKGYEAELQAYLKNPMMLKATNPDLAAQFDAIIKQRMLTPTSKPTGPVRD